MYLSIVIPFNTIQYTVGCIKSIEKHTQKLEYEIIAVNNGCHRSIKDYVQHPCLKEVRCSKRGFAPAINKGIEASSGKYVLLLNNDTLVGPNWVQNMIKCIDTVERAGIVGPRTNVALAEQRIPNTGLGENVIKIEKFMERFNIHDPEKWYEVEFITGFCMLILREVIDKAGLFDEGYEIGCYEDADYIVRVRKEGYRIMCAGDTFVYHYGHKSLFQVIDRYRLCEIIEKNKKRYHEKWGELAKEPRA